MRTQKSNITQKFFLFLLCLCFHSELKAAHYAAIVIDADSGKIHHTHEADHPNYPASLTKMMTLYILFEELEKGNLKLNSLLTVSQNAARQPPTKINVKPGTQITVKQAIEALATKSANDAAVVVAEAISDSEENFAVRMTKTAKKLGMTKTQFYNASGLPHPYQKSTARDLATLGLALMHHFPKFYYFFSTKYFHYKGKSYPNHNRLLFSYEGCTGLKTGYTRAAGFNLAASATRNNKNLIAVVMGEKSPAARNNKMKKLLDSCFKDFGSIGSGQFQFATLKTEKSGADSEQKPIPQKAILKLDEQKEETLTALNKAENKENYQKTSLKEVSLKAPLSSYQEPPLKPSLNPDKKVIIQVGSYNTKEAAQKAAQKAVKSSQGLMILNNIYIEPISLKGKKLFRAQIKNVDASHFTKICHLMKNQKLPCLSITQTETIAASPKILAHVPKKAISSKTKQKKTKKRSTKHKH